MLGTRQGSLQLGEFSVERFRAGVDGGGGDDRAVLRGSGAGQLRQLLLGRLQPLGDDADERRLARAADGRVAPAARARRGERMAGGALRRGARVEFRHRDGDLVGDARILDVLARERAAAQELLQPAAGEDAEQARARAHRGERLERGDLLLAAEELVRAQPVDAQQHRVHRRAGAAARELVQLVRQPALHHVHLELLRRQPGPARQALQAGQHPPRLLLPERLR